MAGRKLKTLYTLMSSPALLFAALITASLVVVTLMRWLNASRFPHRQHFDDEGFGRTFFASGGRADIATRARRVLAENLESDLGGLRPGDRFDEDINAGMSTNVDLFWQLENEFQIDCQVEDLAEFEKTVSQLVTFADLVRYLQKRIDATRDAGARDKGSAVSEADLDVLDVVGYSWFTGIAMFAASSMFDVGWLVTAGLTVAFLPLIIFVVYEVYQGLTEVARHVRADGYEILFRHPVSLLISLAALLPILGWMAWLSWVLFSLYFLDAAPD